MRTMVCFRTDQGRFALPVESTVAVRKADGLVDLPGSHPDIVGILPGDPPLSVLSSLGTGGDHVLVLLCADGRFGLQVGEVLGVRRFEDDQIGPPPRGQAGGLITGVLYEQGELVLVADPRAIAAQL
jgi:chemotaxis signal transduction protein